MVLNFIFKGLEDTLDSMILYVFVNYEFCTINWWERRLLLKKPILTQQM